MSQSLTVKYWITPASVSFSTVWTVKAKDGIAIMARRRIIFFISKKGVMLRVNLETGILCPIVSYKANIFYILSIF